LDRGGAGAALHPVGDGGLQFSGSTKRPAGRNEDGSRSVETDWTPVEPWNPLAAACQRLLHKGSRMRMQRDRLQRAKAGDFRTSLQRLGGG